MNKTAALAGKLLDAATDPKLANQVMPKVARLLKQGHPVQATVHESSKTAEADKQAMAQAAFAAWAIARGKTYTENECKAMLDRLGVPFVTAEEGKAKRKSGPLAVGETVYPDRNQNTNEQNSDACRKYHLQIGQVEKVERDGVAVRFEDNRLVRFEGGNTPGKDIGLYRGTPANVVEQRPTGKAAVEIVYISDKNAKPPTKTQVEQVLDYVEKGEARGESRNKAYYTGLALKQSEGKNGYYFTIFSQQRDRFPRSINPRKGTVLYIGRLGGRPGGWMKEYEKMVAGVQSE